MNFFNGQLDLPRLEEKVLELWKKNRTFEKSLALRQAQGKKHFVFFEGPPYANGKPGIHHVLARIYKDIILRYRSMRGFYVPRRAGWDTHGLPVEIAAEKALGLKSKKEIEKFGIERFNEEAKKAVWIYKDEWENLTERIGYWLDLKNAYITYEPEYIETLWQVIKKIHQRGLFYKAHKVVPWCPRCGTALSSHELAQGYKEVEDKSVYVKFKLKKGQKIGRWITGGRSYILSWTTTPWTLPGNAALAVGKNISYAAAEKDGEELWYAKESPIAKELNPNGKETKGKNLIGLRYEPLFNIPKLKNEKAYRIYDADFVATNEGTGVVHTAVMYGEDDYNLGRKEGLLQYHTVDEDGRFAKDVKGFAGLSVKAEETEKKIFEYLGKKKLLLKAEPYRHEYPFCWRCGSAVIYYARDSWFIAMSKLREELLRQNKKINWVPEHVKNGRFGEWLKEAKDWNLSRERYWGAPLPVWECSKCKGIEVIGSIDEMKKKEVPRNEFLFLRHGEADNNLQGITGPSKDSKKYTSHLTAKGKERVKKTAEIIAKKKIDLIVSSPLARARETAEIVRRATSIKVIYRQELGDINPGIFVWKPEKEHHDYFKNEMEKFGTPPPQGESWNEAKRRMAKAFSEINIKFKGKRILVISHGDPLWLLKGAIEGLPDEKILTAPYPQPGELYKIDSRPLPLDDNGNLNLHRPYVDQIVLRCSRCRGNMERIKEVADVWFDSGAMPFASAEHPFAFAQNQKLPKNYPADYISEGMDQTRGWFYTLLAVATALGFETPYKNVIALGLINDKFGQKMSKSKGNVVDPWEVIGKYGADAVRWYFYTSSPPGESKNFDEQGIVKAFRKFHSLIYNSFVFYKTYANKKISVNQRKNQRKSAFLLDKWILTRLQETAALATTRLEHYDVREAALILENFADDLSRWYIRRSRRRFQLALRSFSEEGKPAGKKGYESACQTLGFVLSELAKLTAPFCPFFAEGLYGSLSGQKNTSVHLENWPVASSTKLEVRSSKLINDMNEIRRLASLGLAKRTEAGIKVRQPLASLKIKNRELSKQKELLKILCEEVNVKKVVFDKKISDDVELDTKITSELREEGMIRELRRIIQDLRQEAGLKPQNKIVLFMELPQEIRGAVLRNEKTLKTSVNAKEIEYKKSGKFSAEMETKIDNLPLWLALKKVG